MSSQDDALTRALRARARDAVDSEVVLGRVLAGVERRRRSRQLAGLGATTLAVTGLVVGVQLVLPAGPTAPQEIPVAADPATTPAACDPPGGPGHLDDLLEAYFGAGYDADDASTLGDVWQLGFFEAKVVAGQRLQDGVPLPVAGTGPTGRPLADEAREALGENDVDADDVAELSRLWQSDDPDLVAVVAGVRLLDGAAPPCL